MTDINHPWEAEYRPKKLEDLLCSSHLHDKLKSYTDSESMPNLLFVGDSGTGKTTAAKILANEISGGEYMYISASDKNDIATMRNEVKDYCYSVAMSGLKIIVLDEADFLTAQSQAMLRNITEDFQQHCRFIMTANYENRLIKPLQSRFQKFVFEGVDKKLIFKRCVGILKDKGVTYDEDAKTNLISIIKAYYPDIRSIINNMQKNTIDNTLSFNTVHDDNEIETIIGHIKTGKINLIREQCISRNTFYEKMYRDLYDNVTKITKDPLNVGKIIVTLADYQYKHALVVDYEINFIACIFEIFEIIRDENK